MSLFVYLQYDSEGADDRPPDLPEAADSWLYLPSAHSVKEGDVMVLASLDHRSEVSTVVAEPTLTHDGEVLAPLKVVTLLDTDEAKQAAIRAGVTMCGVVTSGLAAEDFVDLLELGWLRQHI